MAAAHALAFGEPSGQGWTQVAELAIAFALSLAIGLEREVQQKSAGARTYTLVGVGSALFLLISKYGFSDVLRDGVVLDPSRVAAQIVTGLGFIGGGLIFVRNDAVRGLTTAASVWLTAAVGAAAGAGLWLLAVTTTALYFVTLYGLRPVSRWARRFRADAQRLQVTYLDGRGLLRDVVTRTTAYGFAVAELDTHAAAEGEVTVVLALTGKGDVTPLSVTLGELDGVLAVQTRPDELDE